MLPTLYSLRGPSAVEENCLVLGLSWQIILGYLSPLFIPSPDCGEDLDIWISRACLLSSLALGPEDWPLSRLRAEHRKEDCVTHGGRGGQRKEGWLLSVWKSLIFSYI